MKRVIQLAVVIGLVTVGATTAKADNRTVFETKSGVFVNTSGDRWLEKRDGDVDSQFTELERTDDYVELYDSDRKLKVRLYCDRGEAFHKGIQEWRKWPGSEGKWRAR